MAGIGALLGTSLAPCSDLQTLPFPEISIPGCVVSLHSSCTSALPSRLVLQNPTTCQHQTPQAPCCMDGQEAIKHRPAAEAIILDS